MDHDVVDRILPRLAAIRDAAQGIGWGYYDSLCEALATEFPRVADDVDLNQAGRRPAAARGSDDVGVVLGLYRLRNMRGHELLGWAEVFPAAAAVDALRGLVEGNQKVRGRTQGAPLRVGDEFVDKHVPEWNELIARVLGRG